MANELSIHHVSGKTVYFAVRSGSSFAKKLINGQWMLETYNAGNWTDYAIAGTEIGATGIYQATVAGGLPAGDYITESYEQAGASPAITDPYLGGGIIAWDGTAEIFQFNPASHIVKATNQAGGVIPTASENAVATEARILDEDDGGAVQAALVAKIEEADLNLGEVTVGAIASAAASAILAIPTNKLATNASGQVTASNPGLTVEQAAILSTIAGNVAGLDGAAMRGTDGAYTGIPPTVEQIQAGLATEAGQAVLVTAIASIPTNPLLANDGRLPTTVIAARSDLPESPDNTAIAIIHDKVLTIQTGSISLTSPVADTGTLTLVRGDDYSVVTNKAIVFEDTGTTCPDLTDALSATLTVRLVKGDTLQLTKAGTVIGPRSVRFEPTHDDTAHLICGSLNSRYDVQCILADGSVVTPWMGEATIIADMTY